MDSKTYVWSFFGRIKHWLIVISFILCYITSFYEEKLTLHVVIGIVVFNLLLLKIVWGLTGPKYARWSDYKFELKDLKFYFVEKIQNRYRKISAGHNPASSWFAFLIVWIGLLTCISGFLLYGIQEGKGLFSFLNSQYYSYMEILEYIHIVLVYISIALILTHVTGVLIEQFYHKTSMVFAMITGYKKAIGENITTSSLQNLLASIYVIGTLVFAVYIYGDKSNVFIKSKFTKIDYKLEHEDFYMECSDCHNLFPPHLLPSSSWVKLMNDQHEHYGEDLELEEDMVQLIKSYLITNSSEKSSREESYYFTKEIKDSKLYTITKLNTWKKRHQNIKDETFKKEDIESKSNCVACHKNFEKGILEDDKISPIL